MGIFSQSNSITETFLKNKRFKRSPWGSPDEIKYNDVKKNKFYNRSKCSWNPERYMWEKFYKNYYVYYFPENFEGYVNIRRSEINNHAGWMVAQRNWDSWNEWVCIKVEDEADFELALSEIRKQLNFGEEDFV